MRDSEFDALLKEALFEAAELDYFSNMPPDEELDKLIKPSKRFLKNMEKISKNPQQYIRARRRPMYQKILQTAAMIIVTIAVLFGALMAHPTVRAKVLEFISTWFGDHTRYEIVDDTQSVMPKSIEFGYIPEGFCLDFEIIEDTLCSMQYENNSQEYFILEIRNSDAKALIDNEHSEFYQVYMGDILVDVYERNDSEILNVLVYYSDHKIVQLTGTLDVEELMLILENMSME